MKITKEQLKKIIMEELGTFLQEQGLRYGSDPLTEGAIQDFAKKWGVPIALAGTLMTTQGCANNPFSKNCDISSTYRTENPRMATIKLMRKYSIKSFLMDGSVEMGRFVPSRGMARKFPNLKGGVDVSDAGRDMEMQQLIVLQKAVGEI